MGHFRGRPAPGTGRAPGAGRAGGGASRGRADRAAGAGDTAAIVPGAGRRPGHRPQHGRRGVRPARRGGLADRRARLGHPGRQHLRGPPGASGGRPAAGRTPVARHDLRPGSPDLSAFPRAGWLSAARKALSAAPSQALGYSDPRGRPELRSVLAAYLGRTRGVRVAPDRIVVCAGFTQGLALLCQVLPDAGVTRIAVEDYGQPHTAGTRGLRPRPGHARRRRRRRGTGRGARRAGDAAHPGAPVPPRLGAVTTAPRGGCPLGR